MAEVEVPGVKLTAADRCDRCGARACVVTEHDNGRLLWCAHHARVHRDALVEHIVTDEPLPA